MYTCFHSRYENDLQCLYKEKVLIKQQLIDCEASEKELMIKFTLKVQSQRYFLTTSQHLHQPTTKKNFPFLKSHVAQKSKNCVRFIDVFEVFSGKQRAIHCELQNTKKSWNETVLFRHQYIYIYFWCVQKKILLLFLKIVVN